MTYMSNRFYMFLLKVDVPVTDRHGEKHGICLGFFLQLQGVSLHSQPRAQEPGKRHMFSLQGQHTAQVKWMFNVSRYMIYSYFLAK